MPPREVVVDATYRHYGNEQLYRVDRISLDAETLERRVEYTALYEEMQPWSHREVDFLATVVNEVGETVNRFELVVDQQMYRIAWWGVNNYFHDHREAGEIFRGIRVEGADLAPDASERNPVYYRVYISEEDRFVPVCMQPFDEVDYDPKKFLLDQRYANESDCKRVCEAANILLGEVHRHVGVEHCYPMMKQMLANLGVL